MIAGQLEIQLLTGIARLQADMDRANRIVGDATSRMGHAAGIAKAALGAIAGALSVGAFAAMIKGSIDAMDNLKDLSVTTKIVIEDLAGLKLAAAQSGSDLEGTAEAISKLSANMGKNAERFARLGVTSKDPLEAFKQLADVFSAIEDPQLRAAFAADALGKSWKASAPLLAEGSARIGEMIERGKALAGVTTEMAYKADEFNDMMAEMGALAEGVKLRLAGDMLPAIVDVTKAITSAYDESGKLQALWMALGALGAFAFTDEFSSATVKIKNLNAELEVLRQDKALSEMSLQPGFIGRWLFGKSDIAGEIANVEAKLKGLNDEMNRPAKEASTKAEAEAKEKARKEAEAAAAEFLKLGEEARKKAEAAREAAAKKSAQEYASAVKAASDFAMGLKIESSQIGLNADQVRMMTAAREAAKAPTAALRMEIMQEALALDIAAKAASVNAEAQKAADTLQKTFTDDAANVWEQVRALEGQIATYGLVGAAVVELERTKVQAQLLSLELSAEETAALEMKLAGLDRLAMRQQQLAGMGQQGTSVTQAKDLLEIMVQVDEATKSAADGMVASFGRVGSAIGGLTTALSGYGRAQAAIAAQLAADKVKDKNDPAKLAKLEIAAANASTQARMKSYGDISGAAKSFFKENSSGYKAMEKVEKTFRAMEMAMAIKSMITKLFATEAVTAAVVVGKTAEMGAMGAAAAVDTATTGVSIGNSIAKTTASTIAGVAKAFEQLGVWGFVGAAAILAYMGAFGGTGGGGPAATTFEDKQKKQGTGTVLGDDDAKSASIANSLEIMEGYAALELDYQSSMLTALRNIESALGGAAKNILQTTGITGGSAFGTQNSAEQNFFSSDKSTTITDSGVMFAGTFGNLRAGRGSGKQYEDVSKTSDGGWFHGNSTNNYTNSKGLTAAAMKPFTLIFDNMGDLLVDAGIKLGKDGGTLEKAINAMPINFQVSLRNLKGQELEDELAAGIGVALDQVTIALFPTIEKFRKMGEGLGETLVRVAADVMAVDSVFAAMGKSTGLMAIETKELLVEAVGGLDKFASSASSFMKNFGSDAEQQSATKARLSPVLSKFGLRTEGTDAQKMFKDFVLGLNTSTLAGRETYATLMNLQQAFKDVTQAAADERLDLLDQLDELTMTQVQLLNKQRKALDPSNRALFDQIEALKAMREAQDSTKSSLGDVISRMKSFGDSARSLRDSLLMGALTTLTPEQQYAEARRQRDATRAAALGGDAAAQSNLSAMQTAFLTISQKVNGGDSQYSADFASVLQMSDEIAKWSSGQVDVAQASLDALNAQVLGIANLNATMLAVSGGIDQMVGTPNYSAMGTPDMAPLVAEIKLLRQEVTTLRAEQKTQTGDLIASNGQVTLAAAERVVSGATEIETESSWAARNPGREILR